MSERLNRHGCFPESKNAGETALDCSCSGSGSIAPSPNGKAWDFDSHSIGSIPIGVVSRYIGITQDDSPIDFDEQGNGEKALHKCPNCGFEW